MKKLLVLVLLMVTLLAVGCTSQESQEVQKPQREEYKRAGYSFITRNKSETGKFICIIEVSGKYGDKYELKLDLDNFSPLELYVALCKSKYSLEIVDNEVVSWELIPQKERIEVFKNRISSKVEEVECKNYTRTTGFLNEDENFPFLILTVQDECGLQYDISLEDYDIEETAYILNRGREFKLKIKDGKILDWEVTRYGLY